MTQEYTEYLAVHVLNEKECVTYRTLSRALKVHCNLAKQMLWEFHRRENSKKPGSVHATYLISGHRNPRPISTSNVVPSQQDDDTVMQSSPPLPSSSAALSEDAASEPISFRSILLVREEQLDEAKETFEQISGVHIYSLQPDGLGDYQALVECGRKIAAISVNEDASQSSKQYGTIQNANVKRRTRKTPISATAALNERAKPMPPVTKLTDVHSKPGAAVKATTTSEEQQVSSKKALPATVKRQTSDIFKSFAKGANMPKKASTETPATSKTTPPPANDEPMGGMSDEDLDVDADDAEIEVNAPSGKTKKDRQAELEAMMEAEDEEMDDLEESNADTPSQEPIEEEQAKPAQVEEPRETVVVENGRRRGRRRVMKKKTVKDEEGYLVTKEEAVWESFSEDERPPKRTKTLPAGPAAKDGKTSSRPGQGSIMSFFAKK